MICPAMLSAGLMNWTEAELITDAVLGAHQLGVGAVRDLESVIGPGCSQRQVGLTGDVVRDIGLVRKVWAIRCCLLNILHL